MFSRNYFPSSYFPDSYFFGILGNTRRLYIQWVKEGKPTFFTYNAITYMKIINPNIEFIALSALQEAELFTSHHLFELDYAWSNVVRSTDLRTNISFSTLTLDSGELLTFDNGRSVEITI